MQYLDVTQIEYNRTPYQRYDQRATVDNYIYSFYRQLMISLRIDIVILSTQYSFKHVTNIYAHR